MKAQGKLGTREGYLSELKRLFAAAGHRHNEYKPFKVAFEGKAKARGWDFPGSSVYYPWRSGQALPSKQYAKLFDALIGWLLDLAMTAGDGSFPPRGAWSKALSDLHEGKPAGRGSDARRSSPSGVAADLARWCASEGARYRAALSRLPYLAGHPNPEGHNITAYTRLGVRRGSSADPRSGSDPYRLASDDPSNRAVEMAYLDAVADRVQLVIAGDAGIGKTWLLQHHAGVLAQEAAERLRSRGSRSDAPIPVLVRADTLADAHLPGRSLAGSAVQALAHSGSRIPKSIADKLISILREGPVVYLIDALDETTPDQYAVLSELLNPLENSHPSTRYVVTTRLASYVGIFHHAQRTEAELLPFESPVPYIDSWELPQDRRAHLLDRIAGHRAIAQMARIPLLLAFLCQLAKEGSEDFPDSRAQLYERITRRFLLAEHKPHRPNLRSARTDALSADPNTRADELLDILHPLAYRIATDANGWLDTIPRRVMLDHLKHVESPRGLSAAAMLALLAGDAGILVPTSGTMAGRTPGYRFIHRTFAEYLTAAYVAASPELIEHCSRHHLHLAADWHQTWLLCVQLSPADTLSALIGHPQDALHIAMNVAADAVDELSEAQRQDAAEQITALTEAAARLLETTTRTELNDLAAKALGVAGGAAAVASLSRALLVPAREFRHHDSPLVWHVFNKTSITKALARTGHPAAITTLAQVVTGELPGVEVFSGEDLYSVRADAARALASFDHPEAVARLTAIVNNPRSDPAFGVLWYLSDSDQPETIDLIIEKLIDDENDAADRRAARGALTRWGGFCDDAAKEARGRAVGRALVAAATGHRPEGDTQLVTGLSDLFWASGDDDFLRGGAFDLLASLNSSDTIPTLLQVLCEEPAENEWWRRLHDDAMRALGRVKAIESIDFLVEVLLGTRELRPVHDPRVRALETLVDILEGHPAPGDARERAMDALTRVCGDTEHPLAGAAAVALVRIGGEATIRANRAHLMTLLDRRDCAELVRALAEANSPTATEMMLEKVPLSAESADFWLFWDRSEMHSIKVLNVLLTVALDPDYSPAARVDACGRLLVFRRSAAIDVLRGIFEDERSDQDDCEKALAALGSVCDVPTLKAVIASSRPDQLKAFAGGLRETNHKVPKGMDEYADLLECLTIARESGDRVLQAAAAAAALGLRFATVIPRHRTSRALAALWSLTVSAAFKHPDRLTSGDVSRQEHVAGATRPSSM